MKKKMKNVYFHQAGEDEKKMKNVYFHQAGEEEKKRKMFIFIRQVRMKKEEKCLFSNTQEFLHNIFITSFK